MPRSDADPAGSAGRDSGSRPLVAGATARTPDVPGYEIVGELGRGGMGVVYRAIQTGLRRPVALKMVLAGDLAASEELTRFRSEAAAAAQLHHPNVVQVFDIGEYDGRVFFSMELIPGGSLADHTAAGPLPPEEAARVLEMIARGVHAAHQRGIVHRDLKPGNILLGLPTVPGQLGTPKITDFGLARFGSSNLTMADAILGTPSYMAPEQALGQSRDVTPAADIWSLGAILYECLTGQPPFDGESALAVIERVRFEPVVPPSHLEPAVPAELEAICLTCLSKSPECRYRSAASLADDLKRFLAGEPLRDAAGSDAVVFPGLPVRDGPVTNPGRNVPVGFKVRAEMSRDESVVVYEAIQEAQNRPVALTVRAHRLSQADARLSAWRTAAALLARLTHPNLARILQFGEQGGLCFHAEELLDGGTLGEQLDGSPWAPEASAGLVASLARALHQVHQHGLAHGRLTPDHVGLATGGEGGEPVPKLRGFAALRPGEPVGMLSSSSGDRFAAYTAPELKGGDTVPSPASDLYALGVLLYQLFSGRTPGGSGRQRTSEEATPVPPALKLVCLRCLQSSPARRHPSALALADDIQRAIEGRPTQPWVEGEDGRPQSGSVIP
jgi:serine/threonine protein kinase